MASWTNDAHLHALMRAYLAAVNRLEQAADTEGATSEVDRLRAEKRAAAQAYEEALLARGWQIPGLVVGPLSRVTRW